MPAPRGACRCGCSRSLEGTWRSQASPTTPLCRLCRLFHCPENAPKWDTQTSSSYFLTCSSFRASSNFRDPCVSPQGRCCRAADKMDDALEQLPTRPLGCVILMWLRRPGKQPGDLQWANWWQHSPRASLAAPPARARVQIPAGSIAELLFHSHSDSMKSQVIFLAKHFFYFFYFFSLFHPSQTSCCPFISSCDSHVMNEGDGCALAAVPTGVILGCTTGDNTPLICWKVPSPRQPGPAPAQGAGMLHRRGMCSARLLKLGVC